MRRQSLNIKNNMALPMDSELSELFVFVKLEIVKLVVLCSWFIELYRPLIDSFHVWSTEHDRIG